MELPFEPFSLLRGTHQQTIISSFLHLEKDPKSHRMMVTLPDLDSIALEVTTPKGWKPTDPTVVMIHGLSGSHRSPYLIRMTKKLAKNNVRAVRLNLRSCGSGKGHAKHICHAGRSDDVLAALLQLKKETPDSPISLIGFSLGGNIALKLAGELKDRAHTLLEKVIAIGPPIDLYSSVKLGNQKKNRFYEKYFIRLLKAEKKHRYKKYPDLKKVDLPRKLTMFEFDNLYTAPEAGFKDALDYYKKSSSGRLILDISIPCNILFSEDDPIIPSDLLDAIKLPDNIRVYKTKYGGHMGYLGSPLSKGGFHWMDEVLLEWLSGNM